MSTKEAAPISSSDLKDETQKTLADEPQPTYSQIK